jgi:hypothetical protein
LIGTISVKTFENFGTLGNSFLQLFSFPQNFGIQFYIKLKWPYALPYLQMMKTCVATEAIVKIFARIIYDFIDTTVDV